MTTDDTLDRLCALACWAELATDAVKHTEGYEFTTPTGFYYVMTDDEAEDYLADHLEQEWRGESSRDCFVSVQAEAEAQSDFYQRAKWDGRGAAIACDRVEHEFQDWFIYKVANR